MPRIYRSMKRAADGMPLVGTNSNELGVRIPPNEHADIDVDEMGDVVLNGRGMSVVCDWRYLMPHLIPKRLKSHVHGATGSNALSVNRYGDGPFTGGTMTEQLLLELKPASTRQGNLVPAHAMPVAEYLERIADTRDRWIVEEPIS